MLELRLPYPPSVNHYWRRVGTKTLISRGGRAFRVRVCSLLASRTVKPMAGPLSVDVVIHPPDKRRRDIDNIAKALLDALQHGGAYFDDSQIVRLSIEKGAVEPGGYSIVRIKGVVA